ncbi:MAG: TetR/AcrR family transcriptional regulator [Bdellovibrionales bacterium]
MRKTKTQSQDAKIAAAAHSLAARKGWPQVTLEDIAKSAKIPVASFKKRFSSTRDIVGVLIKDGGREALAKVGKPTGSPRDVLFDHIMARFEVMQKDRKAILSINEAMLQDASLAYIMVCATRENIEAIIDATSNESSLRPILIVKLFAVFGWTFAAWVKDDTRDMSKTMAALDKALRMEEKIMEVLGARP